MGSQSRQPEKNRSHVIDAPPDDDNDDVESGLFLPVKEAHSGGENSTTASLDQNTSPAEFRRHFNYVYFHQITLVFAIAIPLLIVAIVLITVHLGDIKGYAAPRLVRDTMGSALLGVVNNQPCPITFLINNHHANEPRLEVARHDHLGHRRRRTLLSLGLGTAIHGMSAFAALSGVDGALSANDFVCLLAYQEPGDEPVRRCMQFAAWFNIVLFFYLTLLCIFGYVFHSSCLSGTDPG